MTRCTILLAFVLSGCAVLDEAAGPATNAAIRFTDPVLADKIEADVEVAVAAGSETPWADAFKGNWVAVLLAGGVALLGAYGVNKSTAKGRLAVTAAGIMANALNSVTSTEAREEIKKRTAASNKIDGDDLPKAMRDAGIL